MWGSVVGTTKALRRASFIHWRRWDRRNVISDAVMTRKGLDKGRGGMPLPVVIHAGQWLPAMCRDRTVGMYGANLRIIFVSVHVLCAKKEKDVAQRHIQRLCPF